MSIYGYLIQHTFAITSDKIKVFNNSTSSSLFWLYWFIDTGAGKAGCCLHFSGKIVQILSLTIYINYGRSFEGALLPHTS